MKRRCPVKTQSGTQCSRTTDERFCWQHAQIASQIEQRRDNTELTTTPGSKGVVLQLWGQELADHLFIVKTAMLVSDRVRWRPGAEVQQRLGRSALSVDGFADLKELASSDRFAFKVDDMARPFDESEYKSDDPSTLHNAEVQLHWGDEYVEYLVIRELPIGSESDGTAGRAILSALNDDPDESADISRLGINPIHFVDRLPERITRNYPLFAYRRLIDDIRDRRQITILDEEARATLAFVRDLIDDLRRDHDDWDEDPDYTRLVEGIFKSAGEPSSWFEAAAEASFNAAHHYTMFALPWAHHYPPELLLAWIDELSDSLDAYNELVAKLWADFDNSGAGSRSTFQLDELCRVLDQQYEELRRHVRSSRLLSVTKRNLPEFVGQQTMAVVPALILSGAFVVLLTSGMVTVGQAVKNTWEGVRERSRVSAEVGATPMYWQYQLSPENWTTMPDWLIE